MAARSAVRSAVPLSTGKPPSTVRNAPRGRFSHRLSLPMKRSRRPVAIPAIGVSMKDRCTGDRMNGPGGKFSLPSTRSLNSSLHRARTRDHRNP